MCSKREQGQGLVEYALILVLIAVTVIMVISLLGTRVQGAFENVVTAMGGGTVGAVTATRLGDGNANDVNVNITVIGTQTVTVFDSQSGKSQTATCTNACTVTMTGVGQLAGTLTITANSHSRTASYPAKN